jgi:CBS domain-containing protein
MGAIQVERTVSCPVRRRAVSLRACLDQACCAGFEEDELGCYVRCEEHDLASQQLVHLPVRLSGGSDPLLHARAERTPISAIMTPDVLCVRSDVSVDALVPLLLDNHISGVPVVDATGAPIGIVSKTDLVRERYENGDVLELERGEPRMRGFHDSGLARKVVADVMMAMALSLPEDATVAQASALMAYEGVHRIPVVCGEGKVVGMLSAIDVLRWLAHAEGYLLATRHA